MTLHKKNIDFDAHCAHTIGQHVQGEHEPDRSNTNAPRTIDCSCLRPSCNAQKGHGLLHLQTNKVENCRQTWTVPVTTSVVQHTHTLAGMDGTSKVLKIKN